MLKIYSTEIKKEPNEFDFEVEDSPFNYNLEDSKTENEEIPGQIIGGIKPENIKLPPPEDSEFASFEDSKMENSEIREIPCPFCQKLFHKRGNLNIHIRSVHEKKKPFICDICQAAFATKG